MRKMLFLVDDDVREALRLAAFEGGGYALSHALNVALAEHFGLPAREQRKRGPKPGTPKKKAAPKPRKVRKA